MRLCGRHVLLSQPGARIPALPSITQHNPALNIIPLMRITHKGKTYVACALAQQACREGYSVRYLRLPRLLSELAIARGDGRYPRMLAALARADLIVLDDWGTAALASEQCRELLEILEDRYSA